MASRPAPPRSPCARKASSGPGRRGRPRRTPRTSVGGAGARPCPRPRTPAAPRAARCPAGNGGVRGRVRAGAVCRRCPPAPPAHPVVGVRPAGARLLPAVRRGQLPALLDADAPAAARGPAPGGLAHLRGQGRSRHRPHLCSRLPRPPTLCTARRAARPRVPRIRPCLQRLPAPGPTAGHISVPGSPPDREVLTAAAAALPAGARRWQAVAVLRAGLREPQERWGGRGSSSSPAKSRKSRGNCEDRREVARSQRGGSAQGRRLARRP